MLSCSVASDFCSPMDCSLPGSSVLGIIQPRILEWVTMPSSRQSSDPEITPVFPLTPALQGDSLPPSHWGSLYNIIVVIWQFYFQCLKESPHCSP